ncbi:contact-dependent growth inhibition system immunity protein [Mucilaginibacter sp. RCC_168]|uniref:contact-dependent growth inhibition system immunity protein n=1 Tax=Mucilaginibacter sp. RCC_168 TaxID=3239221 RepID=UPI0035232EA2
MKPENNWKYISLFNLEKTRVDNPGEAPTRLVTRCTELVKIPLNEYSIEDLRLMIGQELGLSYLVPLAIEKLTDDLFAEGDLYEGDLLANVLKINRTFWKQNPDLWTQVDNLIVNRKYEIDKLKISVEKFYN